MYYFTINVSPFYFFFELVREKWRPTSSWQTFPHPPPNFAFFPLFLTTYWVQLALPACPWARGRIHWSMGSLTGTTSMDKTGSPSFCSHQLSIESKLGVWLLRILLECPLAWADLVQGSWLLWHCKDTYFSPTVEKTLFAAFSLSICLLKIFLPFLSFKMFLDLTEMGSLI